MLESLIKKLEVRDALSEQEKRALHESVGRTHDFAQQTDIVIDGSRPTESTLMLEGVSARYKVVADGGRQITGIHIAGDFVDLHSFLVKTMDHGVVALTPCRVALVPHQRLRDITEQFPHLARLLWLNTLIDAAIFREWIIGMGRRSATAQMAHWFCEMLVRHRVIGRNNGNAFPLPITQVELGDALGLSHVHVNRVLQDLRGEGLVTWREGWLTITDWDRLAQMAEFDPTYLTLETEPR